MKEMRTETFKEYLATGMRAMEPVEPDFERQSEKDAFRNGARCALSFAGGYLAKFSDEQRKGIAT